MNRCELWFLCVVAMIVAGCTCNTSEKQKLHVFAASSLTESFEALKSEFERAHPNVDVDFTFAGSQTLRLQIEHGADADVYASANRSHLQALANAGRVDPPTPFAYNELVIITPNRTNNAIAQFQDLATAKHIVIGNAEVPVGQYTQVMFDRAGKKFGENFIDAIQAHIVSRESNVRLVRTKVELGEADAAVVYRSDALDRNLHTIEIPQDINVAAEYTITKVHGSKIPDIADAWIHFVTNPAGQATLRNFGFATVQNPAKGQP